MSPAKVRKVDDGNRVAIRVSKTEPCSTDSHACSRSLLLDVKAHTAISALRFLNPQLFRQQQTRLVNMFHNRELKANSPMHIPRGLQVGVDMHSIAQVSPVRAPSGLKIYCTADVDLAVFPAANLVDAGGGWNLGELFAWFHRAITSLPRHELPPVFRTTSRWMSS